MQKSFLQQAARVVVVSAVLAGMIGAATAWTAPSATAPSSNTSAPIDVSATAQTKAGNFTSSGTITASSFYQGSLRAWPFGGVYNTYGWWNGNTGGPSCPSGYVARRFFADYVGCCNPHPYYDMYQCNYQ